MPNGKTHDKASLISMVVTVTAMLFLEYPYVIILGALLGFVLSLRVNPDLDLNIPFPAGRPLLWLSWIFWWPYSRSFAHRSFWSHMPVISTFIRVTYLMLPSLLILSLAERFVPISIDYNQVQKIIAGITGGLMVSDTLHFVMDIISTGWKRRGLHR